MTGHMQSELQREEQRKEVKQWGWVLRSVCDYLPYVYIQENTIISSACIWEIDLYMYPTYSVQILYMCVFVLVCACLWGPGRNSCSVHAMSGRAGVSLMVPYVTTLPPSFLRLMSVT